MKSKKNLNKIVITSLIILAILSIYALFSIPSKKMDFKQQNTVKAESAASSYSSKGDLSPNTVSELASEVEASYSSQYNDTDQSVETSPIPAATVAEQSENTLNNSNVLDTPIASGTMEVHFLDVGQGDATLITCDGEAMLIASGDPNQGTKIQLYLTKQGISSLKYLVLSHPDSDHIGGAPVIITKYDIGTVFMSGYQKPDGHKTSERLQEALSYKYINPVIPSVGSSYRLGNADFTFIGPISYQADEPNNASLALIVQYGNNRFLFTGDAEETEENDILNTGINIQSDVYKVGHHGSNSSSSSPFLQAIRPTYVVISCGRDNTYGHPHDSTLQRLNSIGANIFRTDLQGTVVAVSDGNNIYWLTLFGAD
ncbi:MAG: MBL fold metallo-hydrolase [Lachnospiraceae bacterium]|nr:MBL fold metallo-hydrolase [Lachnospiraceae bacterium]